MTPAEMVREFHEAIGAPVLDVPTVPGIGRCVLRKALHDEESREVADELDRAWTCDGNELLPRLAKELADVLVVTYGTALEFGIDLDAVMAEVHASNMSKVEGIERRNDGKVLKGPNYRPPNVAAVLGLEGDSCRTFLRGGARLWSHSPRPPSA